MGGRRRSGGPQSIGSRKSPDTPEATGHAGTQCSLLAKQAAQPQGGHGSAPGRRPVLPLPMRPPGGAAARAGTRRSYDCLLAGTAVQLSALSHQPGLLR